CQQHGASARGEHSNEKPARPEDEPHRQSEQNDCNEREVSEVMRQAASNHLDNVRRARDSNSKILPVELLDDGFDTVNESFAIFRMDERDDVAGFLILDNQEPTPEGTLLGVAKILR